jgi:hypothetical protein
VFFIFLYKFYLTYAHQLRLVQCILMR